MNVNLIAGNLGGGHQHSSFQAAIQTMQTQSHSSRTNYVKKETTQLSPVKKRIKENKDHYIGMQCILCSLDLAH